jgi:uridine kinase
VYEKVKQAMLPQIIFLYGAPKTGKTTVAKHLADRIGYELVELGNFYKHSNHRDRLAAVNELIHHLKFSNKSYFVIDDVLPTKEEYTIFAHQLGEPFRIFSFEAPKD